MLKLEVFKVADPAPSVVAIILWVPCTIYLVDSGIECVPKSYNVPLSKCVASLYFAMFRVNFYVIFHLQFRTSGTVYKFPACSDRNDSVLESNNARFYLQQYIGRVVKNHMVYLIGLTNFGRQHRWWRETGEEWARSHFPRIH